MHGILDTPLFLRGANPGLTGRHPPPIYLYGLFAEAYNVWYIHIKKSSTKKAWAGTPYMQQQHASLANARFYVQNHAL